MDTLTGGGKNKKALTNQSTVATSVESGMKIRSENEEIFQGADQIGKSPDGSNIGTYKEICSLASDLNRYYFLIQMIMHFLLMFKIDIKIFFNFFKTRPDLPVHEFSSPQHDLEHQTRCSIWF